MLTQQVQPSQKNHISPTTPFIEFNPKEIEQSIPARFEQQVVKYPGRLAVKTSRQSLNYESLNKIANRIAQTLLAQYGPEEVPVALLFENDIPMIAAILGVLKAGKICVPLDPFYPQARLAYMLADSQATLLITNNKHSAMGNELAQTGCQLLNIDQPQPHVSAKNPNLATSPDAIAYILYTSGSTGQPKGIVHNHRNLLHNIMNYTNALHICSDDRLTLLHSCSFSSGIIDVFCALLNGATLCSWNVKKEGLADLAHWVTQEGITIFGWTPTPFRHFAETFTNSTSFPKLRLLLLGGEPVFNIDAALYKKYFSPECLMVNRLGTTETNNFRLYFLDKDTDLKEDRVPAGYAVDDKEVLLFDEDGKEVGYNQPGEIVVKSRYLALGYWQKPELTQNAFRPDPEDETLRLYFTGDMGLLRPDGCLEYYGRKDFQVKIRGHRIETTGIEAALVKHSEVAQVAVVAHEDKHGHKYLVAYVVPHQGCNPKSSELHRSLIEKLPDYMIPSTFIMLDTLPLTPGGKMDRRALPLPDQSHNSSGRPFTPPQSTIELKLAQIWEQTLNIQPIGTQDNFFELGGHSLLATRMLAQIEELTGKKLPLITLFQSPTIEQLAKTLQQQEPQKFTGSLVPIQSGGSKPPFFCIPGNLGNVHTDLNYLAKHLGPEQPFYGFQDGIPNPSKIEAIAAQYIAEMQNVQPEGPYLLGGVCSGGVIAFEMAQRLQAKGQQVKLLALIEPSPPRGGFAPWVYFNFVVATIRRFIRRLGHQSRRIVELDTITERGIYFRLKLKLLANSLGERRYTPQPYPGQIYLFLTEESYNSANNPQFNWQQFATKGAEIFQIPGTHNSITGNDSTEIEETHMQVLAEQLNTCINETLKDRNDNLWKHQPARTPFMTCSKLKTGKSPIT